MSAKAQSDGESPREQTAAVCDEIREELGRTEYHGQGIPTLTQTEKRAILNALRDN